MGARTALEFDIQATPEGNGSTRLDLMHDGRSVSRLWIVPFTLRVGAAVVRMDGIGGVGTDTEYRNRGLARRVLEAALVRMRSGDAALSMLYGIQNLYHKFGYATAGPDHFIALERLDQEAPLPPGWSARPFRAEDLPALQQLYDAATSRATGAAVRVEGSGVWQRLLVPAVDPAHDACRVVRAPDGRVRGYAWRGQGFWYVHILEKREPAALVLAEVVADGPASADAVLAACRAWAREESEGRERPLDRVLLAHPPDGHLAAAAMRQSADLIQRCSPAGDSMARVLDLGRLLEALRPELERRLHAAPSPFTGTLTLRTDFGEAALAATPGGLTVQPRPDLEIPGEHLSLELPQMELARLALGAFPPEDILARLPAPPDARAAEVLVQLFPHRHPHMHLPDRF